MHLRIRDVAALLGVSRSTIRRWLSQRKIPAYFINNRYRFDRNEIESWVMEKKVSLQREEMSEDGRQFALYRAIHRGGVHHRIAGESKTEVISNCIANISQQLDLDAKTLGSLFLDREEMMSTALNRGVAIPHTREFLLPYPYDVVAVAFPEKAIDYEALDGEPVHTLFFLISSTHKSHLYLLSKIAYLCSDEKMMGVLRQRPHYEALIEEIRRWETRVQGKRD